MAAIVEFGGIPFNGTSEPTGGDSLNTNLNQWYPSGDSAFIMISATMCFLMVPGLGYFYSGLARRKSALSLIFICFLSYTVVCFQWYFWGYSLAFSSTATNGFIGNLDSFCLINVLALPSVGSAYISELLYAVFQCQFGAVAFAIWIGAAAERGRVLPIIPIAFVWMTLVYCPLACWAWSANGWAYKYGVLDYAGGGPVEIASGFSALAYSYILGPRRGIDMTGYRPHNISYVVMGTMLLWFGWFGFNAGTAGGANLRAVVAFVGTNLAGCVGGITWLLMDFRLEKKYSVVGFCSGCIAGLVAATPSCGYIPIHASVLTGFLAAAVSNMLTKLKFYLRVDDSNDVLSEHGIAGWVGLIMNGLFAADYIIALDGIHGGSAVITGGWINRHYVQLGWQIAYIAACSSYSFVMTYIILWTINKIPGLNLRVCDEAEEKGIDAWEIGEFAYDYVSIRPEVNSWNMPRKALEGLVHDSVQSRLNGGEGSKSEGSKSDNDTILSDHHTGEAAQELEKGDVHPSGRGGGELKVQEKARDDGFSGN